MTDIDDIVTVLRLLSSGESASASAVDLAAVCSAAADEIERLRRAKRAIEELASQLADAIGYHLHRVGYDHDRVVSIGDALDAFEVFVRSCPEPATVVVVVAGIACGSFCGEHAVAVSGTLSRIGRDTITVSHTSDRCDWTPAASWPAFWLARLG